MRPHAQVIFMDISIVNKMRLEEMHIKVNPALEPTLALRLRLRLRPSLTRTSILALTLAFTCPLTLALTRWTISSCC